MSAKVLRPMIGSSSTPGHLASMSKFDRALLPDPLVYYEAEGLKLIGHGRWRTTRCCFHEDKKPSLSVNVEHGGFKCHACGAKGGDVLAFHMLRHGLAFVSAAKALGAWRGTR